MDLTTPPRSPSTRPTPGWPWPRSLEIGLAFVLGGCAALVLQGLWSRWAVSGQPAYARPAPGLDLNHANAQELAQVPGLGPKRAQRIVQERDKGGIFSSPDDLQRVPGIGGRTVDRVRKHLQTSSTSPAPSHPLGEKTPSGSTPRGKRAPTEPIDLNRATGADLQQIPGIGPVLAQRILEYRAAHGPFRDVRELTKIKGIKERTLEKLQPYLRVGEEAAD